MEQIESAPTPVAALRALDPERGAVLEARCDHPWARYDVVALRARLELVGNQDGLTLVDVDTASVVETYANEWGPLARVFDDARDRRAFTGVPFAGGWLGYVGYEAHHVIHGTPAPQAWPPARPGLDWVHLRWYQDAIVYDRRNGTCTLVVNEVEGDVDDARQRTRQVIERLRNADQDRAPPPTTRGKPVATLTPADFQKRVSTLRDLIRDGDCFQVNLTSSFAYRWTKPPTPGGLLTLYDEYAASNPGAWAGYYHAGKATILSGSPECLYVQEGDSLKARPIAGTRRRGTTVDLDRALARELAHDPKEQAEHAMLVDLVRNDVAAVASASTTQVSEFASLEYYRHVMHLVSAVEAQLGPRGRRSDVFASMFPGGTVTGAPKRRAIERITQFERGPRGPYTGSLGYVSANGCVQWNILIRTLVATPTHLVAHAGCGIVEASDPGREADELQAKARAQVDAAVGAATPAPESMLCGRVDAADAWRPGAAEPRHRHARVLLVDCEDSFVHNLADYARRLGARTRTVTADAPVESAWAWNPTHVILSPGPGRPSDFPSLALHLDQAQTRSTPVLGICLGHQAIAEHQGASIIRHRETVHGKATPVFVTAQRRLDPVLGAWRGERVGRYHSLVLQDVPPTLTPLLQLGDGTPMAVRHRDLPWWGLQFHPESLLTQDGMSIMDAFLGVQP